LSLSWFGLTYGSYRLEVGNEKLFSYSEQMSAIWTAESPGFCGDYVDYQVVRLWEDILEILPNVLEPIPLELAQLFSTHNLQVSALNQRVEKSLRSGHINQDIAKAAVCWIQDRTLDTGYLINGPSIWLWSDQDSVTITWDNRNSLINGVEVWSAKHGSYSMPRSVFLKEVELFNDDFIAQMSQRVDDICAGWNRPHIRIDIENLRKQQLERPRELEHKLHFPANPIDSKKILTAIEIVMQANP